MEQPFITSHNHDNDWKWKNVSEKSVSFDT